MNSHELKLVKTAETKDYLPIHKWLIYHFEKTGKCEFCKTVSAKKYEWALLKGKEYKRKRENYIELCCKCHRNYDGNMPGGWNKGKKGLQVAWNKGKRWSKEIRKKMSLAKIGKPSWKKGTGKRTREEALEYYRNYYRTHKKNERPRTETN